MITIATAIRSLVGDVEFTIIDEDLSNIQWNSEPAQIPTENEIIEEFDRLKNLEEAKKTALLSKLNINSDEAKLLLS